MIFFLKTYTSNDLSPVYTLENDYCKVTYLSFAFM